MGGPRRNRKTPVPGARGSTKRRILCGIPFTETVVGFRVGDDGEQRPMLFTCMCGQAYRSRGPSLKRGMPRRCGKMAHSALSPKKVSSGHPSDRVCCFEFHPLWPVCTEAMGFILGSCLMPGPSIMGFTITGFTITGVHCQGGFIGAAATAATDATDPKA